MTSIRSLLPSIALIAACEAPDPTPTGRSPTEVVNKHVPEAPAETPEFTGVVTSLKSEMIPVAFTGRIARLDVRPGQRVRGGDRIAKLDETDLRDKIEGLKKQEAASRATAGAHGALASQAKKETRANERLLALGAVSRMSVQSKGAEAASAGAQAGAAAAQGEVSKFDRKVLERQLENAEIKAKHDGVVMMVKAKEGAVVQQGEAIARIYDPSDLVVKFAVPKEHRAKIKKGGRVELRIEGVQRTIWAQIEDYADEEAPINFIIVIANIDDTKLGPDEVGLASIARVRIVEPDRRSQPAAQAVAQGARRS